MCRSCGDVPGNEYETQPQPSEKRAFEQGVLRLPRGGIVVTTAKGISIQFGIPPETIKDCFRQNVPVPQIFCLPKELFDRVHGVNVAEAEFPAYFNFFVLQKRVTFLGEFSFVLSCFAGLSLRRSFPFFFVLFFCSGFALTNCRGSC